MDRTPQFSRRSMLSGTAATFIMVAPNFSLKASICGTDSAGIFFLATPSWMAFVCISRIWCMTFACEKTASVQTDPINM